MKSREGEETDRGFLLGRLVWSPDFDLVFVRGRFLYGGWLSVRRRSQPGTPVGRGRSGM